MYEQRNLSPAKDMKDLLGNPKGILFTEGLLEEALAFVETGKGRFSPDGAFHAKQSTLGDAVENPTPGHRMIRNHLLVTAVYAQGLSFVFDRIDACKSVSELVDTNVVFKEANINRSLMLMNLHYKANGDKCASQVTLSALTSMALADTPRNRQRMRDKVAPVLVAHGLWEKENIDGEKANFCAGPLMVMFAEFVFGRMKPLDGESV